MSALDTQIGGGHYKAMAIQPMEFSMANKLDACQHTAIKYITRFREKAGVEDLRKAIHCIEMLIEFEERGASKAPSEKQGDTLVCRRPVPYTVDAPMADKDYLTSPGEPDSALVFRRPVPFKVNVAPVFPESLNTTNSELPQQVAGPNWAAWLGGKNPFATPGVEVRVKLRNGNSWTADADSLDWSHYGVYSDIVAYEVLHKDPVGDWTPWFGVGAPPLPQSARVAVRRRDTTVLVDDLSNITWRHTGFDKDVMAYRVAT